MEPCGQPARLTVRYAETDQMGVAYYANYLVWMEVGRVELLKKLGLRYRDLEREGYLLAVAEAHCRYRQPARYDEEVEIETRVSRATARFVQFEYRIRRAGDGAILATGYTKHVICDRELRPKRLEGKYARVLVEATEEEAGRL
jgi:acyl-CoA thioester hydrolase